MTDYQKSQRLAILAGMAWGGLANALGVPLWITLFVACFIGWYMRDVVRWIEARDD